MAANKRQTTCHYLLTILVINLHSFVVTLILIVLFNYYDEYK